MLLLALNTELLTKINFPHFGVRKDRFSVALGYNMAFTDYVRFFAYVEGFPDIVVSEQDTDTP